jgi:uncharacterized membrane protein
LGKKVRRIVAPAARARRTGTSAVSEIVAVFKEPSPRVRRVAIDRPWRWLELGWADLRRAPRVSLAYGAALAAASMLLVMALLPANLVYLVLPLAAGFFLVAPILAVGLYETSRRLEYGQPVSLRHALLAVRINAGQIALMGLVLMLFHLVWVRLATLLFALFFFDGNPGWNGMIDALFFSRVSLSFLVTGTFVGGALAAIVFGIGAVSIPMLIDRPVTVFTAIATSWTAVQINWKPMVLWAALIAFFTGVGLATFFVGLAVSLPLIGHASWHAYRDLVEG